jgi:hypothetical protein
MTHARGYQARALVGAACFALGALVAGIAAPVRAADRAVIAVADFYSPGAPPIVQITDPERYAADVSAGALVRAGGDALTVLPRSEVRAAEASLGWHTRDGLNFSRLGALAQALHADRVLVGWINRATVYRQDFALFAADAAVNTQVFDTRQGRIIWQRESFGSGLAGLPDFALQIALERAAARGAQAAVAAASADVDRPAPTP